MSAKEGKKTRKPVTDGIRSKRKKLQEQEVQNTKRYNREGNVTKEIELDEKNWYNRHHISFVLFSNN